MGPARYRDLNSDLPVCITQDRLSDNEKIVAAVNAGPRLQFELLADK